MTKKVSKKKTSKKKTSKKMGVPRKPFDWHTFDKYLQYKPSLVDCSELMKCSITLINERCKEKHGLTFIEYRDKKMAHTRLSLTQKALTMALNGHPTMMIFCLKNICGWENEATQEQKNFSLSYKVTKIENPTLIKEN